MTDAEISARFELAAGIAREAGALALSYFRDRERLVVETKANPQDVVSIADQEIERLIRARVAACHSSDGFLGERTGSSWARAASPGSSTRSTARARS